MRRDTYAQALPPPPASTAWESFLRIAGVTGRRLPAGRHVAHVHPQTVPVRWVNGDGEPEPVVLFVEPNSIDLEDRDPPIGGGRIRKHRRVTPLGAHLEWLT